jgi:hypothetical protein
MRFATKHGQNCADTRAHHVGTAHSQTGPLRMLKQATMVKNGFHNNV